MAVASGESSVLTSHLRSFRLQFPQALEGPEGALDEHELTVSSGDLFGGKAPVAGVNDVLAVVTGGVPYLGPV